ncbi:oligosaccharide flippase family protein [Bacillus sp. BGMRC 2118]|nr:oligosaccharide flippase family protein [Bacillus sp. BGMRC 2118]
MMMVLKNKLLRSSFGKNVIGMGIFRVLGIITNFLLVGLIYRYFSNDAINGIWLTIFSILTWMTFFDFGMGNSLRNKLTESIARNNISLSNAYISTTYILMIIPTVIALIIAVIIVIFLDWQSIFNVDGIKYSNSYLTLFICVVVFLYSLNFYLSILNAILHSIYKSYLISLIQLGINLVNILIISILYFLEINDLIVLGFVYIGTSIVILSLSTIIIFRYNRFNLRFSLIYFRSDLVKDILKFGGKFLILQLGVIILFNTDNFIISKYIGVEQVTPYQLVYKLLGISTIVLGLFLTPIWTKVINDKSLNKIREIKNSIKKLIILFALLGIITVVIGFMSPVIINYWTGSKIIMPSKLIPFLIIFVIFNMWCNIFQSILNGLNKLNLQILCYGFAAIINIPLCILLIKVTNLGVSAVILGNIFSFLVPGVVLPMYTFRILKNYDLINENNKID